MTISLFLTLYGSVLCCSKKSHFCLFPAIVIFIWNTILLPVKRHSFLCTMKMMMMGLYVKQIWCKRIYFSIFFYITRATEFILILLLHIVTKRILSHSIIMYKDLERVVNIVISRVFFLRIGRISLFYVLFCLGHEFVYYLLIFTQHSCNSWDVLWIMVLLWRRSRKKNFIFLLLFSEHQFWIFK